MKNPIINISNMDCMEAMKATRYNHYDLAIVDPPYGICEDGGSNHRRGKATAPTLYAQKKWDRKVLDTNYFKELRRISKNQVVWGANHFIGNIQNPNSSCWIVWDKQNGDTDFSDCELAWTSFKTAVRKLSFRWNGMLQGNMKEKEKRIHPTQKPVALYKWLLEKYAEKGQTILDTHLGSGSIAIACWDLGFDLDGYELDEDYYKSACGRLEEHKKQLFLFR